MPLCTTVGPVSDLVSMLVPLQTMPGWNNVETPSALWILLLAIGIPFGFGIVVTIVTMGPGWVRSSRGEVNVAEPVWLGEGAQPKAVQAEVSDEEATSVGGSSARW